MKDEKLLSVCVHEIGHFVCLESFGVDLQVEEATISLKKTCNGNDNFSFAGELTVVDDHKLSDWKRAVIACGGPIAEARFISGEDVHLRQQGKGGIRQSQKS